MSKIAKIHTALAGLAGILDLEEFCEENNVDIDQVNTVYADLSRLLPGGSVDTERVADEQTKDDSDDGRLEFSLDDPYVEQAYHALKTESKPCVAYLKASVLPRLGEKRLQRILDSLVADGHIKLYDPNDKNPAAATKPKESKGKSDKKGEGKSDKKSKGKADKKPKKGKGKKSKGAPTLEQLLQDLPAGSNTLVNPPFNLLMVLNKKERKRYLQGLNLTVMVNADSVSQAAKDGADLTLVNEIIALADKKRKPVTEPVDVSKKSVQKQVAAWITVIPNGDVLFNHMAQMGLDKTVLKHFKKIAKAVRDEEISV